MNRLEQENADLRAGLEHAHGQWKVVFGRRGQTPPVVRPDPVPTPSADSTTAETEGGPVAGGGR